MNLFQLTALLAWMAGATVVGVYLGARFGVASGLLGAVGAAAILALLRRGLLGWIGDFPTCRSGRTLRREEVAADRIRYRCECGDEYLLRPSGAARARLFRVDPGGRATPYMRRGFWGKWRPDEAA